MRVESTFTNSYLIGSTPYGKTDIHRTIVDQQGRTSHTVETHPFFSYTAYGSLEAIKELGKNIDKTV